MLLAAFVAGAVAWTLGASWAFVRVAGFLAEGPSEVSIDNRSGEALVVTLTQVGAVRGTRHPLPADASGWTTWGGCAETEVVVELRRVPDTEVSRERMEVCDGDRVVVVGAGYDVSVG
ncbi:MAG: hypothetical protein ACKOVB_05465 [Terrabacter sp.]